MTDVNPPRRRRATQARSKATVQKILDATTALIVERGARGVTMSEIARRADLVIGSLYQYFTDRSAIYRAVLIRHNAEARTLLHHFVSQARTLDEFIDALNALFDSYFELLQRDRLVIGLWEIVQTDPQLMALDVEDSLQNARYIARVSAPMLPGIEEARLVAANALLIQYSLYAGRIARELPPEIACEVPALYKAMLSQLFRQTLAPEET